MITEKFKSMMSAVTYIVGVNGDLPFTITALPTHDVPLLTTQVEVYVIGCEDTALGEVEVTKGDGERCIDFIARVNLPVDYYRR